MELVKYEIYKIFSKRIVLIGLIVLIPVYLIYNFGTNSTFLSSYREANRYYRTYEGKLDSTKESKISEGKKDVDELGKKGVKLDSRHLAMKILYDDMIEVLNDRENLKIIETNLESRLQSGKVKGFEYRKTAMEIKSVSGADVLTSLYFTEGWRAFINFHRNAGYWFILILSLLGISGIISQEYQDGVNSLIRSTMKGRRELAAAKIAAVSVFVFIVTAFTGVLNLITNAYYYSLSGSDVSIRNIYDLFQNTPRGISIWQFCLTMEVYAFLGAFIICLVYCLLSVYIRNPGIPFALILTAFLASSAAAKGKIGFAIKGFLPSEIIRVSNLFKDYSFIYDFFGRPVTYEVMLFAADIVVLIVLSSAIIKSFGKWGLRE